MFVLGCLSLLLSQSASQPVSGREVLPSPQLAPLALVTATQRNQPRHRRQQQAVVEAVSQSEAETAAAELRDPEEVVRPRAGRTLSFQADIARILAAARAGPTPVDPSGSYAGRRRRRSEPVFHSNAHQYGLVEPKVELVKVKSHGNYGKVAQSGGPGVARRVKQEDFVNGAKERRKRGSQHFIPFSVYENRRTKTLKVEENDFHALPARLQIEKLRAQLSRQAKALRIANTARAL